MHTQGNGSGLEVCCDSDQTVNISVRLLASLKSYAPAGDGEFTLAVARRETVATFLDRFDFPAALQPVVVINGRPSQATTLFSEGDSILVFEPVTGG